MLEDDAALPTILPAAAWNWLTCERVIPAEWPFSLFEFSCLRLRACA